MYEVKPEILEKYLNLEAEESDLFPAGCQPGTRLEDLMPVDDDSAACTLEHFANVMEQFLDEEISFERLQAWIGCILETDLFVLDDAKGEKALDWMFNTLCYLASFEDEDTILDKVDFGRLIEKAEEF